jgi:hypothetical protein
MIYLTNKKQNHKSKTYSFLSDMLMASIAMRTAALNLEHSGGLSRSRGGEMAR